jgi:hypothetical protein
MGARRDAGTLAVGCTAVRAAVIPLLLFAGSSCQGDDAIVSPPAITWEGQNLVYGSDDPAEELCSGTLPYSDAYVGHLRSIFEVMGGAPVEFYHVDTTTDPLWCDGRGTALGCTVGQRVFSSVVPHEHELVHAARSEEGLAHIFFEEGVAEAFGDDAQLGTRGPPGRPFMATIDAAMGSRLEPEDYARAGHFTAYLTREFGDSALAQVLRDTKLGDASERVMQVLEGATETEFDKLLAAYEQESECGQATYRSPDFVCDAPAYQQPSCVDGTLYRIEESIDCGAPDVLGPRDGEIWQYATISLPEDDTYAFYITGSPPSDVDRVEVKQCLAGCDSVFIELEVDPAGLVDFVELPAGSFSLRLTRGQNEPGVVRISVDREGPVSACE